MERGESRGRSRAAQVDLITRRDPNGRRSPSFFLFLSTYSPPHSPPNSQTFYPSTRLKLSTPRHVFHPPNRAGDGAVAVVGRGSSGEVVAALPRPRLADATITVGWNDGTELPLEFVPGAYKYVGEINGNPTFEQQTRWNVGEDRVRRCWALWWWLERRGCTTKLKTLDATHHTLDSQIPGQHELQRDDDEKADALEASAGEASAEAMSKEAKERARRKMLRADAKSSGALKMWRPPRGSRIDRIVHLWRYSFNQQNQADKGKDAWYIAKLGVPPGSSGKDGDIDFYVTKALVRETTCRVPPGVAHWFTPSG